MTSLENSPIHLEVETQFRLVGGNIPLLEETLVGYDQEGLDAVRTKAAEIREQLIAIEPEGYFEPRITYPLAVSALTGRRGVLIHEPMLQQMLESAPKAPIQ